LLKHAVGVFSIITPLIPPSHVYLAAEWVRGVCGRRVGGVGEWGWGGEGWGER
jgi:hypothetical protein